MITVKIHDAGNGRKVLAILDSELIGKTLEEDNIQIDLSSDFYKGDEKSDEEVKDLLKDTYVVNFVGEKSVKIGMDANLIDERSIIKVQNIPHAQSMN